MNTQRHALRSASRKSDPRRGNGVKCFCVGADRTNKETDFSCMETLRVWRAELSYGTSSAYKTDSTRSYFIMQFDRPFVVLYQPWNQGTDDKVWVMTGQQLVIDEADLAAPHNEYTTRIQRMLESADSHVYNVKLNQIGAVERGWVERTWNVRAYEELEII